MASSTYQYRLEERQKELEALRGRSLTKSLACQLKDAEAPLKVIDFMEKQREEFFRERRNKTEAKEIMHRFKGDPSTMAAILQHREDEAIALLQRYQTAKDNILERTKGIWQDKFDPNEDSPTAGFDDSPQYELRSQGTTEAETDSVPSEIELLMSLSEDPGVSDDAVELDLPKLTFVWFSFVTMCSTNVVGISFGLLMLALNLQADSSAPGEILRALQSRLVVSMIEDLVHVMEKVADDLIHRSSIQVGNGCTAISSSSPPKYPAVEEALRNSSSKSWFQGSTNLVQEVLSYFGSKDALGNPFGAIDTRSMIWGQTSEVSTFVRSNTDLFSNLLGQRDVSCVSCHNNDLVVATVSGACETDLEIECLREDIPEPLLPPSEPSDSDEIPELDVIPSIDVSGQDCASFCSANEFEDSVGEYETPRSDNGLEFWTDTIAEPSDCLESSSTDEDENMEPEGMTGAIEPIQEEAMQDYVESIASPEEASASIEEYIEDEENDKLVDGTKSTSLDEEEAMETPSLNIVFLQDRNKSEEHVYLESCSRASSDSTSEKLIVISATAGDDQEECMEVTLFDDEGTTRRGLSSFSEREDADCREDFDACEKEAFDDRDDAGCSQERDGVMSVEREAAAEIEFFDSYEEESHRESNKWNPSEEDDEFEVVLLSNDGSSKGIPQKRPNRMYTQLSLGAAVVVGVGASFVLGMKRR
eukprot:Nitzschia sp. Nitz4//scaffold120_size68122//31588//33859//NITZ4_006045-RA/size68122-augustus-gene-0.56-mRNA-1//1//CDS//3329534281//9023//frame0